MNAERSRVDSGAGAGKWIVGFVRPGIYESDPIELLRLDDPRPHFRKRRLPAPAQRDERAPVAGQVEPVEIGTRGPPLRDGDRGLSLRWGPAGAAVEIDVLASRA